MTVRTIEGWEPSYGMALKVMPAGYDDDGVVLEWDIWDSNRPCPCGECDGVISAQGSVVVMGFDTAQEAIDYINLVKKT
jgi:hypothetical protein